MLSSKRKAKREDIESVGKASFRFPYALDMGSLALVCGIGFITVLVAAIPKENASASLSRPGNESLLQEASPMSLSLEELLMAMRARLREQNVSSGVQFARSVIRVMTDGPMHALSDAKLLQNREREARAVAETLAWAIHCHIDFGTQDAKTGELPTGRLFTKRDGSVCRLPAQSLIPSPSRSECLPGKGRVQLGHISFQGHTDSVPFKKQPRGEFRDNQGLSEGRADRFAASILACTRDDLMQLGKDASIPFETEGFASRLPAQQPGLDPRNRRVEIHFRERGEGDGSFDIR